MEASNELRTSHTHLGREVGVCSVQLFLGASAVFVTGPRSDGILALLCGSSSPVLGFSNIWGPPVKMAWATTKGSGGGQLQKKAVRRCLATRSSSPQRDNPTAMKRPTGAATRRRALVRSSFCSQSLEQDRGECECKCVS